MILLCRHLKIRAILYYIPALKNNENESDENYEIDDDGIPTHQVLLH